MLAIWELPFLYTSTSEQVRSQLNERTVDLSQQAMLLEPEVQKYHKQVHNQSLLSLQDPVYVKQDFTDHSFFANCL